MVAEEDEAEDEEMEGAETAPEMMTAKGAGIATTANRMNSFTVMQNAGNWRRTKAYAQMDGSQFLTNRMGRGLTVN